MKTELRIKKDVDEDGKQTFCATIDKKNGLEMMGAGRAVNFAETEMRNTSMWDFFLQMLEFDKTKDEAGDKFKKIVLSIFPKLPYKLLKENYTSPEARDTLRKYLQLLGWRMEDTVTLTRVTNLLDGLMPSVLMTLLVHMLLRLKMP